MAGPKFIGLHEVRETSEPGVYEAIITADIDGNGIEEQVAYGVVPGDTFGIALDVAAAIVVWEQEDKPITPYVPPTVAEIRANMPVLSARQFRLGLVGAGKNLADVDTAIAAIVDPIERQTAEIEWQHATTFQRLHPLVVSLSGSLGFTPEDVDALWTSSLEL
jgi:hypothetical protein